MQKIILLNLSLYLLFACSQTKNGLIFGVPDYEKRNILVSQLDLKILKKTKTLLHDPDVWRKGAARVCGEVETMSLYCALEKASIEVMGRYIHRQAALQEVRFVIEDQYQNRWEIHRLVDFNTHPETTYEEVNLVIQKAISAVNAKLRDQKK